MSAPLDLDAIQARAQAATKGLDWSVRAETLHEGRYHIAGRAPKVVCGIREIAKVARRLDGRVVGADKQAEANADFIAHARQDIPDLLAEVSRLREMLDEARALLEPFAAMCHKSQNVLPDARPLWSFGGDATVTVGNLRAARAWLSHLGEHQETK